MLPPSATTSNYHESVNASVGNSNNNHNLVSVVSTKNISHAATIKSSKHRHACIVMVTSILCFFSVLNFFKETWLVPTTSMYTHNASRGLAQAKEHKNESELTQHNQSNPQELSRSTVLGVVPLDQLVQPARVSTTTCPQGMYPAPMVINITADKGIGRKIPQVIHITGKSACLTEPFRNACHQWSLPSHSLYYHDDQAVDQLLNREWPMFPQLQNTMECLKNAGGGKSSFVVILTFLVSIPYSLCHYHRCIAAKADLWRYLVLWEYGGIYTDLDNLPGPLFNETTIPPDMDAFFLQERGGWLSQYFFAVAPKHPIMFLAVHDVMRGEVFLYFVFCFVVFVFVVVVVVVCVCKSE